MLSKKEIKDIQSLSHKKFRDGLNWFVAEGPKIVEELVERIPGRVHKLYAVREWMDRNRGKTGAVKVDEVSEMELQRISHLQTPNQVLAVLERWPARTPDSEGLVLYLDTIQDPGNFGTIVRTADWFGVNNIVCSGGCADIFSPKVVQSTMASIARVNVYYDTEEKWITEQKAPVLAATLHGTSLYGHAKVQQGVLMIGNESRGISAGLLRHATEQLTIPGKGHAESLNAAVATGIMLSHLL